MGALGALTYFAVTEDDESAPKRPKKRKRKRKRSTAVELPPSALSSADPVSPEPPRVAEPVAQVSPSPALVSQQSEPVSPASLTPVPTSSSGV